MIVTRALPADCDLLRLHRQMPARYPLLLQSTSSSLQTGHAQLRSDMGRWDLLLAASGEALRLDRDGRVRDQDDRDLGGDFLALLDHRWSALRTSHEEPRCWPFRGGWALFLAYELAAQIEPVLRLPQAEGVLPVALALRCPAAVLRDHATGECFAIAEQESASMLQMLLADIDAPDPAPLPAWRSPRSLQEDAPEAFTRGVSRILEYLDAGDAFQVNLSRAWRARSDVSTGEKLPGTAGTDATALDAAALYARLRTASPAPFAGMFAGETAGIPWAVVSSSPERLVSVRGDVVETRPIAGTRPRFDGDDDAARIRELVGHPKERAEHVMLIDLERNDLGRICVPGSVEVNELMTVESYSHVHHIVSNVRGRLRPDATPGATIRAVFPGGTITGCPKVRCMQIIAELEGTGRGAYTGAFGWLNRDGDLDLNILIRSAEIDGDNLRFRTGAGIVADSDPLRELDETRAKARGLLKALGAET
jgi:anthranilate synthase component 1